MKTEHAAGGSGSGRGKPPVAELAESGGSLTHPEGEGPSDKARRNVKLVLLELLTTMDTEILEALSKILPVFLPVLPDIKTVVLQLLEKDPDIKLAVERLTLKPMVRIGDSDAEHAEHVVLLIEEKLKQHIRPDALRKPLP